MPDMAVPNLWTAARPRWSAFLAPGILLLLLGFAAVVVPNVASLAIGILVGWLFLMAGIARLLWTARMRGAPGFWWSIAASVIAIVLGGLLVLRPVEGVVTLTIVMIVMFVAQGATSIVTAVELRRYLPAWGWMLATGIVDLALAALLWAGLPGTAGWALGLLVGINLMVLGAALVMTAMAVRTAERA